jgi:hypothetical protein
MAYPTRLLRLVVAGPLFTTERWSTSLNLCDFGAATTPPTTVAAGLMAAVEGLIYNSSFAPSVGIDSIKLNEITTAGKYSSVLSPVEHVYGSPVVGTGSAMGAPQLAVVASLMTNAMRGYACRGRMFLPPPVYVGNLGTDGRLTTGNQASLGGLITTFLNAINTELDPFRVVVASNIGTGMVREVKAARVGRVLDTIRSRRTSIPEDYLVGSDLTGYDDHGFSGGGGPF